MKPGKNSVKGRSKWAVTGFQDLVDGLDEGDDVVGAVDEEAGGHAVPRRLLRVHLPAAIKGKKIHQPIKEESRGKGAELNLGGNLGKIAVKIKENQQLSIESDQHERTVKNIENGRKTGRKSKKRIDERQKGRGLR